MIYLLLLMIIGIYPIEAGGNDVVFGHEDKSKNLLENWDLESDLSSKDWVVMKAKGTRDKDSNTGSWAMKITDRSAEDGGIHQKVDCKAKSIKADTSYYFSAFVKTLTESSSTYAEIRGYAVITLQGGGTEVINFAKIPFVRKDGIWKHIGGDFRIPQKGCTQASFHLRIYPKDVDYIIDTTSLTEITKYSNWKSAINAKIQKNRMSDINLKVDLGSNSPSGVEVLIELVRHDFGFGTAIKAFQFIKNDPLNQKYRNFVLENFNWAVCENSQKWTISESTKGKMNLNFPDAAITILNNHGFVVRGHAIYWDIEQNNPMWLQKEKASALKNEMWRRLQYMVQHYKSKVQQWDVCNEYFQKHYYEDKTGDYTLFQQELERVHKIDPNVKLFINDYQGVRNGMMTSAFASLARTLQQQKVPIHGVGCQSHLRVLPIPVEVLEKRVQILGSANLPVVFTELSVHSRNENERADGLEMALRVYFSQPSVIGIVLWGFLEDYRYIFCDDCALFKTPDIKPNKAGQVLLDLINKEWHTKEVIKLSKKLTTTTIQAFHGLYNLTISQGSKILHQKQFFVNKNKAASVQVSL